jgi:hypothetical protein
MPTMITHSQKNGLVSATWRFRNVFVLIEMLPSVAAVEAKRFPQLSQNRACGSWGEKHLLQIFEL